MSFPKALIKSWSILLVLLLLLLLLLSVPRAQVLSKPQPSSPPHPFVDLGTTMVGSPSSQHRSLDMQEQGKQEHSNE